MAKRAATAKKAKTGGPFLAAAIFCESIMEGQDKTLSAIKIVDQVQFWLSNEAPAAMPSKEHPIQFAQNVLIVFRTGDSPGKHELRLLTTGPGGKKAKAHTQTIKLSPKPNGGINIKTLMAFNVISPGIYWTDISLDGKRMTRMPLDIRIGRLPK